MDQMTVDGRPVSVRNSSGPWSSHRLHVNSQKSVEPLSGLVITKGKTWQEPRNPSPSEARVVSSPRPPGPIPGAVEGRIAA